MYMVYIYTYICTYKFIYTEMIDDMSTAFFSFWVLNQSAPTSACPLTETLRTYTSDFPFQGKGCPMGPCGKEDLTQKRLGPAMKAALKLSMDPKE